MEVELGENVPLIQAVLAPNGTVAAYGSAALREPVLPVYPLMFMGATLRLVLVYILPEAARARAFGDIARWLEAGTLSHRVAATLRWTASPRRTRSWSAAGAWGRCWSSPEGPVLPGGARGRAGYTSRPGKPGGH